MNIGRHNYEEFFILYMDNELKPSERSMVESFVQLHPDLKDELDLLMQFKIEPDESIVFAAKDELLKEVKVPVVNESNYNDWLLLYVDNELTSSEKLLVDQFLATHPLAQKEWSLLQQTQLQPESIVFAGKSSLYRTEKVKRMPVRWWRIAAAAVLLIAIGLTTAIIVNRNSTGEPEIVKINPVENTTEPDRENKPNPTQEEQKIILPEIRSNEKNALAQNNKPGIIVEKKKPELLIPENKKEDNVAVIKEELPTNNLPKPLENRSIESGKTFSSVAATQNNISDDIALKQAVTIETTPTSIIEDPEEPGKKTKLRGLFRKVARTFEKRTGIATADDDDKLLVAGLAFKLK